VTRGFLSSAPSCNSPRGSERRGFEGRPA
jgi:hypothetical protein